MPTFIITGNYTQSAMKGMLANPSDRAEAARKMTEAAGGKQLAWYATTGATDFLIIVSAEDVTSVLSALMVVGASGAVANIQTQRAFSAEELMAIQKRAGEITASYDAPS